ncbi:hypothetical protein BR93DRAFT_927669 [Coniochaeta sp. PMI_546]|nr:hypothetical protein BR93DRAFT_927669 [Coniochaeta sp. PMI_546]
MCHIHWDSCLHSFCIAGGAGAPLTVGAFNEMRKSGEKLVKESSKLWRAIKALGETLLKIYPTLKAAMANQESFTIPLVGSLIGTSKGVKTGDTRNNIAKQIQQAANDVTSQDIAGKAAEKIDYLGLLADWREFDLQVDKAFAAVWSTLYLTIFSAASTFILVQAEPR